MRCLRDSPGREWEAADHQFCGGGGLAGLEAVKAVGGADGLRGPLTSFLERGWFSVTISPAWRVGRHACAGSTPAVRILEKYSASALSLPASLRPPARIPAPPGTSIALSDLQVVLASEITLCGVG